MNIKNIHLNNYESKTKIFWFFAISIFSLILLYIFFVISTIKNVVAIEDMEISKSELALNIGSNEFKLISMKNEINLDKALASGFEEIKGQNYITRKSVSLVLNRR